MTIFVYAEIKAKMYFEDEVLATTSKPFLSVEKQTKLGFDFKVLSSLFCFLAKLKPLPPKAS